MLFSMEAIYRLNTKDMGIGFVNSLQAAYPDQDVEIRVREQSDCKSGDCNSDDPEWDETEYLLRSPANREHLLNAIKEVAEGKNLITFASAEEAIQCAREHAAKL